MEKINELNSSLWMLYDVFIRSIRNFDSCYLIMNRTSSQLQMGIVHTHFEIYLHNAYQGKPSGEWN